MRVCPSAQIRTEPCTAPLCPIHSCHSTITLKIISAGLSLSFSHPFLFLPCFHFLSQVKSLSTYLRLSFPQFYPFATPILLSSLLFSSFLVIPSPIHPSAGIHNHTVLSPKNHALSLSKSQNPPPPSFPSNYYYYYYFISF